MVRIRLVGGRLIDQRLETAARLHAQGNLAEAVAAYKEVLENNPSHPDALLMMGIIAHQAGNTDLALQFIETALAFNPDFSRAWYNRAVLLRTLGHEDEALSSVRKALEIDLNLAEAWDLVGQIQKNKHLYDEALSSHQKALELQPLSAPFHNNYADLLLNKGDLEAAYATAQKILHIDPDYPAIVLGNILKAMGFPEKAAHCFARIRQQYPFLKDTNVNEAMARLQTGDFERGGALWEQRPDLEAKFAGISFWEGQNVSHLLVYEDQGLGDLIQFLRYIPILRLHVKNITLRVPSSLYQLCLDNFPEIDIQTDLASLNEFDARCRLSSLPFLFKVPLNNVPSAPYLKTYREGRARFRRELDVRTSPHIGIVWAGNRHFRHDNLRSLSFSMFQPLLSRYASHFISLQKDRPEDLGALREMGIVDAAPLIEDFSDTASLIMKLDLVITVDTAVAHLAGALGKPVFILLPFDSDWRWFLGREDSPWYKSARLFRQKTPGDWTDVVLSLTETVEKFIHGDKSVLNAPVWTGEYLHQSPNALVLPPSS